MSKIKIHPTAIISKGAEIDNDVEIDAYAYIGGNVRIGKGTVVQHHATVDGLTELGEDNTIFPYAYIGAQTHDVKYKGGNPGLKIGNHNSFREYTSVHVATNDGEFTVMGSNNLMLAYSHVAHDCVVGDNVVISAHGALGGHVEIDNHAVIGWGAGIHQFCKIGQYAMIGACSKVVQDVPPFMMADGTPAFVKTINKVGLERHEMNEEDFKIIRKLFKVLYRKGYNKSQSIKIIEKEFDIEHVHVKLILNFIQKSSRGLA